MANIVTYLRVKAENLVRDGGSSTRLDLMQVPEHVKPGRSAAIVQLSLGEHPQKSRLADIRGSQDTDPQLDALLVVGDFTNEDLGHEAGTVFGDDHSVSQHLDGGSKTTRHLSERV